jgi:hypothetical protein
MYKSYKQLAKAGLCPFQYLINVFPWEKGKKDPRFPEGPLSM